ncbi:hypothetical protein [Stenotrophomonas maltophilia]|uniref:hypothetical protein n=1 Tax=Stenotrophomonas maltophilia TaxID=40324 RepID=UPI003017BD4F
MDRWYSRKIEVRDVLVSCLVSGGLSAALSWLIFAWARGAEKFPWGSLGDWAAAIGTWVIGYGAWKYAREAHALRIVEVAATEARRLREEVGALRSISYRLETIANCANHLLGELPKGEERVSASGVGASLRSVLPLLKGTSWSEHERAKLSYSVIDTIGLIEVCVLTVGDFSGRLIEVATQSPDMVMSGSYRGIEPVRDSSSRMLAAALESMSEIETTMRQLSDRAETLEFDARHE